MSERQGENEGFFDKVKDFFTGEGREEGERVADEHSYEPTSEDHYQNEDDRLADDAMDPGEDGLGSHDSAGAAEAEEGQQEEDRWDGSGEVPEVEVRESEAVQRHIDETGGAEGYEGRHGGGDDAPAADDGNHDGGPVTPDNPDDEVDTAIERAEQGEPVRAERDGSDGDGDDRADGAVEDSDVDDAADADDSADDLVEDEDARREREEAFAREHDPADHDIDAGEEFRQPGDWAAGEDGPQVQEADGTIHGGGDEGSGAAEAGHDTGAHHGMRESSLEEIRDGGHGWGSAAPIGPDVMPIGHPVKAWYDTGSFVCEGDMGYDDAQPDVWFIDAEAAQRAGFRHGLGD